MASFHTTVYNIVVFRLAIVFPFVLRIFHTCAGAMYDPVRSVVFVVCYLLLLLCLWPSQPLSRSNGLTVYRRPAPGNRENCSRIRIALCLARALVGGGKFASKLCVRQNICVSAAGSKQPQKRHDRKSGGLTARFTVVFAMFVGLCVLLVILMHVVAAA